MDDKTYPYICLTGEAHPRLIVTRNVKLGGKKGQINYLDHTLM
jgi:excinuclease UvrABC nuclease subunit